MANRKHTLTCGYNQSFNGVCDCGADKPVAPEARTSNPVRRYTDGGPDGWMQSPTGEFVRYDDIKHLLQGETGARHFSGCALNHGGNICNCSIGAQRTGPHDPDNDLVICPICTSQFHAVPVNVQNLMQMAAHMVRDTGICRVEGLSRRDIYERLIAPYSAKKSEAPPSDKCEHGIPRRFCTAAHEGEPT